MKRTMTALLLLAPLWTAHGFAAFLDGNRLLEYCTARGGYGEGACDGYVAGMVDSRLSQQDKGITAAGFCLPETVNLGQVVWLVTDYLRTHPEELHFTADSTVHVVLQEAFPCAAPTTD